MRYFKHRFNGILFEFSDDLSKYKYVNHTSYDDWIIVPTRWTETELKEKCKEITREEAFLEIL